MDNKTTIWIKEEAEDDVPEPGITRCSVAAMEEQETSISIKEEEIVEECNEPDSESYVLSAMYNKTTIWIKEEAADDVSEPCITILEDPLKLDELSLQVKQELELKVHTDGSEQKFLDNPLGVYWSTDHINEDSRPNLGWDENEINNAVVNTLLHTILEAESECCPPPLLLPKKELFPDDTLGIPRLTDFIKEDPEMNLEADETENIFFEDPIRVEEPGHHIKEDPELLLDVDDSENTIVENPLGISSSTYFTKELCEQALKMDDSENVVLASTTCIENSTRGIQNCGTSSGISFGETVVQGLVPDELEIHAEEPTCLTMFDTHTKGSEVKEENEESLIVGRLKCSWRENEFHEFICNFCLHRFSSKYILIMHVFNHMDDLQPPTHICRSCGETFSSESDLNRHLKMNDSDQAPYSALNDKADGIYKHKNIFWKCDKVSVTQQSKNQSSPQLKRKALRAAGKKSHKYPVCDKSFSELGNLKTHSLTHTGAEPHKCKVCEKSFNQMCHLNTHSLTHTGVSPHKCSVCDKSFSQLGDLKRHSLTHTGVKPHKCNVCDKSFTQLGNLKKHSLKHTGVKPHKCSVCDKSFTQLSNLKTHSLTHTGVQPHKCNVCDKSFSELRNLKKHSLTHTGVKPHKCSVCDKSFTQLGNLKTHLLTHTGVKPHKCNVCDKSFTELGNLKKHSLTHTGVKPHKCSVCDKSFTQLGNLKRHTLTHTGVKPHKCSVCDKSFTQLGDLKRHSLTHTGV